MAEGNDKIHGGEKELDFKTGNIASTQSHTKQRYFVNVEKNKKKEFFNGFNGLLDKKRKIVLISLVSALAIIVLVLAVILIITSQKPQPVGIQPGTSGEESKEETNYVPKSENGAYDLTVNTVDMSIPEEIVKSLEGVKHADDMIKVLDNAITKASSDEEKSKLYWNLSYYLALSEEANEVQDKIIEYAIKADELSPNANTACRIQTFADIYEKQDLIDKWTPICGQRQGVIIREEGK